MKDECAGRWNQRGRRLSAVLTACCVAALAGGATTASALTIDLACSATVKATFTPALNGGTSALSLVNGQLSGCSSPNGSQPSITSGTFTASGGTATGCFPLFFNASATLNFAWSNGTSSSGPAALSTNPFVPPILSVQVASGTMAGDTATPVPIITPNGLGCGLGGTRSLDAVIITFPFTH